MQKLSRSLKFPHFEGPITIKSTRHNFEVFLSPLIRKKTRKAKKTVTKKLKRNFSFFILFWLNFQTICNAHSAFRKVNKSVSILKYSREVWYFIGHLGEIKLLEKTNSVIKKTSNCAENIFFLYRRKECGNVYL